MSISRFSELLFGEHSIEQEITLQNWRERIFTIVVKISTSLGAIAYLINIISLYKDQNWVMVGIVTIAYLWIVSVTFLKKIPYSLRAGSLIFLLYLLGVSTNLTTASSGDSRIWLITAAIFATVFLGGKLGLIMAGINFVTWLAMGLLFQLDVLNYPFVHVQNLTKPGNFSLWINTGTTALATSAATIASIAAILNNLGTSLQQSRSLADNLEENANQLQEQTIILKRRSQTLETSVQISRTVSAILDSEQILYQTAKLVKEKFNLLHVGIFLVDNSGTAVSLRASYGGGGHTIPAPGYRIPLGKGLIDWVITNSQPRAILENEDTAPLLQMKLSDARSHAVLPLRTRERVLGVIVMQSQEPRAFSSNTLTTLQIMTDQIAIQLDNAQLLAEREAALEAERRAYRESSRSGWKDFARAQSHLGYRRDRYGTATIKDTPEPWREDSQPTLQSIPIQVRGQIIGYVDAKKPSASASWSSAEKELLETLAGRLASALDTARLYEGTRQQAAEEQLIGEVTARMRETLDIETVLQTAVRELRASLDLAEVEVRMRTEPIKNKEVLHD